MDKATGEYTVFFVELTLAIVCEEVRTMVASCITLSIHA